MLIEDVIILGSGASKSDGAPLQNEIFKDYFINIQENDDIYNFFKEFFGIETTDNPQCINFPTFEEILGILELSLNRHESFRNYPLIPSNPKIQHIREQIIFLIAKILKEKLQFRKINHDVLVSRLKREQLLKKTSFISLNYDILIDNALTEIHSEIDLDYGIEFINFKKKKDWHKPRKNRAIKLLKLHGSLNWLYCPTCISLAITPKVKSVSTIAENPKPCELCRTIMVPIIIPPTFFKIMSNHYLQQIWHESENILMTAKRIIFCGYSFPDADIHIKYLIKRVEVNRGTTPDIFIFNNHEGKEEYIKKQEKERYERFFSDKQKVRYLENSFEDFCRDGILNCL